VKRLNAIYKLSRDIKRCGCQNPQTQEYVGGCGKTQPKYKKTSLSISAIRKKDENDDDDDTNESSPVLPETARELMSRISPSDQEFLGFNPVRGRPEWMIITNLAVCPPQVRPSVEMGSGGRAEDDLTTQYLQIIKTNNQLIQQRGAANHAQEE
jgi:DNA-directed RNA polymerase II subunit RPB1